jgi:hypothetical protein
MERTPCLPSKTFNRVGSEIILWFSLLNFRSAPRATSRSELHMSLAMSSLWAMSSLLHTYSSSVVAAGQGVSRAWLVPSLGGSFRIPSNGPSASRKKKEWAIRVRAGRGHDRDGQCVEEHAHLCHDLGFGEIVVWDAWYEGAYCLTFRGKGRGEQCLCLSSSLSCLIKNRWRRLITTVLMNSMHSEQWFAAVCRCAVTCAIESESTEHFLRRSWRSTCLFDDVKILRSIWLALDWNLVADRWILIIWLCQACCSVLNWDTSGHSTNLPCPWFYGSVCPV